MDAINETKKIIEKQVLKNDVFESGEIFGKYSKVYASSNENIAGYMEKIDFQGCSKALTVMSSGDHPFNIALNGIKTIDTFDSNALTEYSVLGIRRSAIIKYDYKQFLNFLKKIISYEISLDEVSDLINAFIPVMDEYYRKYWKEIKDYNYNLQKQYNTNINLFRLLLKDLFTLENIEKNAYLKDEESYNKLRSIIKDVNIRFKCCDITELSNEFNNEYDLAFLSNIPDYLYNVYGYNWRYDSLLDFEESIMKLLKSGGIAVLNYIYAYYFKQKDAYVRHLIRNSCIRKEDLKDEEIISFSNSYFNNDVDAAILIKRK